MVVVLSAALVVALFHALKPSFLAMASGRKSELKTRKTRQGTDNFVVGQPADLPTNVLPTRKQFINCFRNIQREIDPLTRRLTSAAKAKKLACDRVASTWRQEGIPTVSGSRISQLGDICHRRFKKLMKTPKRDRDDTVREREETWFSKLFDIAACKCSDPLNCPCGRDDKVPELEVAFLHDQRTVRRMTTGSIDHEESRRRRVQQDRRERRAQQMTRESPEGPDPYQTHLQVRNLYFR